MPPHVLTAQGGQEPITVTCTQCDFEAVLEPPEEHPRGRNIHFHATGPYYPMSAMTVTNPGDAATDPQLQHRLPPRRFTRRPR